VLLDVSPLRASRDYRLLYVGQLISFLGRQVTVVASAYQVFVLTDSSLQVGLLSLAQLVPLIACSLIGGALADALDRRRLLLVTQFLLAATSLGLALNAMSDAPAVWPIYVLTAASAGLSGVDAPTRAAAIPSLVGLDLIPAAAALNQTQFQVGQVLGPALAGLVIAQFSLATAFWIDVATFGAAIATLLLMAPMIPEGGGTRAGLGSITEGLRYLKGQLAVQGAFLIDINAMVFGMPRALFPQIGTQVYGGGAGTVGLLYAAPGAGALVGALTTGWVSDVRRPGRAVLIAVTVWGLAIAGFGMATWLPLGLFLLAVAGWADVVSAVFRGTILQLQVPDRLRGRLNAINIAVVTGGPRVGDAEAGAVAALTSAQFSVVSGGLLCVAGVAVIDRFRPQLASWRQPDRSSQPQGDP
jgi:MFS family permease